MIKGLLLDYGGTIDTNGMHWGELFWTMYQRHGIHVSNAAFRDAYVFGEKALAVHPLVRPEHRFDDVLRIKLSQQFNNLQAEGRLSSTEDYQGQIEAIASDCDDYVRTCVAAARPVLENLAAKFPLVLVSNFYGNVAAVLEGYGILRFFKQIVESSVVGVRKPDPRIFVLGTAALGFAAEECVVIGDSYRKDIEPAKAAGCYTVWLKGDGWEEDPDVPGAADKIIQRFSDLTTLFAASAAH